MYGNKIVLIYGNEKLYQGVKLVLGQGYTYYVGGFQEIIALEMFTYSIITSSTKWWQNILTADSAFAHKFFVGVYQGQNL